MIKNYNVLSSSRDTWLKNLKMFRYGCMSYQTQKNYKKNSKLLGLFLLIIFLFNYTVQAQVSNYTFAQSTSTFTAPTTGLVGASGATSTTPASIFTTGWDDNAVTMTLPFTFNYNSAPFTQITLSSNGFFVFGSALTPNAAGSAYVSATDPSGVYLSGTSTNNGVAVFNIDQNIRPSTTFTANRTISSNILTAVSSVAGLKVGMRIDGTGITSGAIITAIGTNTITLSANANSTGTGATYTPRTGIYASVSGTAPNRTYTITTVASRRYNNTTDNFDFQYILSETTNTISIIYGSFVGSSASFGAQVGLRTTTSDFNSRTTTTNWSSTSAGLLNTDRCTFSSTIFPSNGLRFTWTPPPPPACGFPLTLAVTDIQATTADLSWAAPSTGTPASYDWEIRTTGAGGSGATGRVAFGNVVAPSLTVNDASGLTSNTAYNLYVRTNCTGGDGSSTWAGPIAFTTRRSCPSGLGVGSVTISSLPYSGTSLTNSGAGDNVTSTNVVCVAGSSSYYGGQDKTYIFTPTITGVHTILLTTGADEDAGIMLYQGCPYTTGSTCVANSQSTTGLTRTIAQSLTAGVTYYLVVDNFPAPAFINSYSLSISLPPNCGVPTTLAATDIQTTTADISWVAPTTGTPASYDWEIRTSGAGGSGSTGLTASGNVLAPTVTVNDASGLTQGTAYNLYVRTNCTGGDGSSTWAGPVAFTTPTAGENCTTAATISVAANLASATNTLLTTGLTSDGPNGTCSDATGNPSKRDRWVKFVAPSSGNKVIVSTSSGTITDAVMQVWSACPATGVALGCSDDVVGLMPQLEFCSLTPGATYYVQIWPYGATETGNFNIRIYEDVACAVPPANDECAGVETITVGAPGSCPGAAVTGTTVDATATPGVVKTSCDAFGTYNDVFYKFNSGSNTSLNFAFTNLTGTNEFGIYSGCGTGFLSVCSSASLSTTLTGLTANTDYFVVVWTNSAAAAGTFSICISTPPAPNCVTSPTAPTNGSTTVNPCIATTLSWPAVSGATSYDVYLDSGSGPAITLVSAAQTTTTYNAGILLGTTSYSWRVVPKNATGDAVGCSDFTFTTTGAPVCATLTAPANASTFCAGPTTFTWNAAAGATAYDVYLDSVLVSDNQTATTYSQSVTAGPHTWSVVPSNCIGEATGCIDFSFTATGNPTGDTFATAIDLGVITASTTVNGDNQNTNCWRNDYTTTSTPGSTSARAGNDVFYKFEITECGSLMDIGTCTSSFDTFIHLLNSTGTRITGDDDTCSAPNGSGSFLSTLALTPGIYYVVVEGFGATDLGTFTLDLTYVSGTPQITYYQDSDSDGFGNAAVSQLACSQPVGFVTNSSDCNDAQIQYFDGDSDNYGTAVQVACGAPNTGDCNDSNAAINPGVAEICYNSIDDNCSGGVNESCPTPTVNMTATTATLPTFSTAVAANPYSLAPYTNLKYRFIITKIQTGQANEVQELTLPTRFVTIPQAMRSYTATYTVRAAAVINDEILAYLGNTMTVNPPSIDPITLSPTSCGATLSNLNASISANPGLNATGYIFRIRRATGTSPVTGPFFTLSSPTRFISANTFSGLPLEYSSAYKVSVAYTYLDPSNNSTQTTAYGAECDLFTLTIPTINLVAPTCGTLLAPAPVSSMTATVAAAPASGATGYQFRIRQTGGSTYFTTGILPSRFTQLSLFGTTLAFSTNYSISVQYYSIIDGVTTPSGYGSECHITTPAHPTTRLVQTQCGNSYTLAQQLNIVAYPGFPKYRVRLTQPDPFNPEEALVIATKEVDYSYFKMGDFPEAQVGETYSVDVAIRINGVFGDYDTQCEITVAPAARTVAVVPFKATAYPNPFAENFMLDVKTESTSLVNVKVYDMVGRLIEQRAVRTSDLETTTIGENYPSGVYNIVVAQEGNLETVRVVKR